jgi:S1-C subfamily serine protease
MLRASQRSGSCFVVIFIAGCVSPSQMLVGPQGDIKRCAANGWGYVGAPLAEHSVHNCVADLKGVGYVPIEEAGFIGVQLSEAGGQLVMVSVVTPDSPASRAGLLVGDQLLKVDGQKVLDRAAARTMMFGKSGTVLNLTVKRDDAEIGIQLQRATRVVAKN